MIPRISDKMGVLLIQTITLYSYLLQLIQGFFVALIEYSRVVIDNNLHVLEIPHIDEM